MRIIANSKVTSKVPCSDIFMDTIYTLWPQLSKDVSDYRIACLHKEGFYPVQILKALRRENLQGSLTSVTRIINKIQKNGSTEIHPRSGRPTRLPVDAKAFMLRYEEWVEI